MAGGHPDPRRPLAFKNGFLDFYDVQVPFDPRVHAEMRSVILVAVFGFVLALGLAIAARRPLAATLVVLVGAGWPATLAGAAGGLGTGVAILLAVLVVLGGLTDPARAARLLSSPGPASPLAAFVVSSSSAVAKGELVALAGLGLLQRPRRARERLVRLERAVRRPRTSRASGRPCSRSRRRPRRSTGGPRVLDRFAGDRWVEVPPTPADFLEPPAARDRTTWIRQGVTVKALADTHLVGAATEVAFDAGDAPIDRASTGGAVAPRSG